MTWMNEYEIDNALGVFNERAPHLYKYARYLSDWRHTVNANSDGWPYWRAGSGCAGKLQSAINDGMNALRTGAAMPDESVFKKALTPIKAFATRKKLPPPALWAPKED